MSISDICITKPGGITSSESLASNLPLLIINPIPGQEEENAEYLEEIEVAIWVKPKESFEQALEKILRKETLEKLKENTKKYAKQNAGSDICKKIIG